MQVDPRDIHRVTKETREGPRSDGRQDVKRIAIAIELKKEEMISLSLSPNFKCS